MTPDDFLLLARDAILGQPPPASLEDAMSRLEEAVRAAPRPEPARAPEGRDVPAQEELAPEEQGE